MPLLQTRKTEKQRTGVTLPVVDGAAEARAEALLRDYTAQYPVVHPEIAKELLSLSDTVVPLLVARTERDNRRSWVYWWSFTAWMFAMTCWVLMDVILSVRHPSPGDHMSVPMSVSLYILTLFSMAFARPEIYREIPVRILIQMDDMRTIGTLVSVATGVQNRSKSGKQLAAEVNACLTRMLPRLSYSDRDLLSERHRALLRQVVRTAAYPPLPLRKTDPEFVFAAVKALVQIRDKKSLPTLRHVAKKSRDPEVRRIASLGICELENSAS